jgi:hypothetical protein
LLLLK